MTSLLSKANEEQEIKDIINAIMIKEEGEGEENAKLEEKEGTFEGSKDDGDLEGVSGVVRGVVERRRVPGVLGLAAGAAVMASIVGGQVGQVGGWNRMKN